MINILSSEKDLKKYYGSSEKAQLLLVVRKFRGCFKKKMAFELVVEYTLDDKNEGRWFSPYE